MADIDNNLRKELKFVNALINFEENWLPMNSMTIESSLFSDQDIINRIANSDVEAYELLFHRFYVELCRFSLKYVHNEEVSEEVVQETFISLWEKRKTLNVHTSLKSYLYTAVKNNALNYLNSQFARQDFQRDFFENADLPVNTTQDALVFDELQVIVQKAITYLPEKCRIIYLMSRNTGMSYQEIANELGISIKTVEAQMGIALRKLREYLNVHWDVLSILILLNSGLLTF